MAENTERLTINTSQLIVLLQSSPASSALLFLSIITTKKCTITAFVEEELRNALFDKMLNKYCEIHIELQVYKKRVQKKIVVVVVVIVPVVFIEVLLTRVGRGKPAAHWLKVNLRAYVTVS